MNRLRRIAAFILLAAGAPASANWSDHWYQPAEPGWGVTVTDHGSNAFVVYYTYGEDGHSTWFTLPGGTFSANRCVFAGAMFRTTGPGYDRATFRPQDVTVAQAGTATLDFCPAGLPAGQARFSYTLNGVTQAKVITRLAFGAASPRWPDDTTDLWWNADESGWGLNVTQQGANVFATWFGYDTDGRALFFTLPAGRRAGNRVEGRIYTTRGPWFGREPFAPAQVAATEAGSATLDFAGSELLSLQYTLNGVTRRKTLTRQPFGSAGTPAAPAPKYVATTGSDATGDGTLARPWRTLRHGIGRLVAGGTLVVRDGTYAGRDNFIAGVPGGSAALPTRVVAESPFGVRITSTASLDYDDNMLLLTGNRIEVDGFIFDMAGTQYPPYIGAVNGGFNTVSRSIFKRAGNIDAYGGLLEVNGSDNLFEDLAGTGACRYCFKQGGTASTVKRNVWRRIVGRFDYSNSAQPKATFATYGNDSAATNGVSDHLYQNVIAIDGQNPGNNGGEEKYGAFYFIKAATQVRVQGAIVLNEGVGYSGLHLRDYAVGTNINSAIHSVVWDLNGSRTGAIGIKAYAGDSLTIGGSIPGNATNLDTGAAPNSLLKPAAGPATLLDNTPGAIVLKRYGAAGTRWGEPGYDQLTADDLWPWPYQDAIKSVFREPNAVPAGNSPAGNDTERGFAAGGSGRYGGPVTLTSYLWEYLGTPCPARYCPR